MTRLILAFVSSVRRCLSPRADEATLHGARYAVLFVDAIDASGKV